MMLSEKTGNWYFPQKFTNLFSFHKKKSLPIQSLRLTWVYTLARRALAALPFKVPDGNRWSCGELQHGRIILLQHMFEKRVLTLFNSLKNQIAKWAPFCHLIKVLGFVSILKFSLFWMNGLQKMQQQKCKRQHLGWRFGRCLKSISLSHARWYFTETLIWDFKEHVSPEYLQQCENLWDRYRKNYIRTTPSEWCVWKKLAACISVTCTSVVCIWANRPGP